MSNLRFFPMLLVLVALVAWTLPAAAQVPGARPAAAAAAPAAAPKQVTPAPARPALQSASSAQLKQVDVSRAPDVRGRVILRDTKTGRFVSRDNVERRLDSAAAFEGPSNKSVADLTLPDRPAHQSPSQTAVGITRTLDKNGATVFRDTKTGDVLSLGQAMRRTAAADAFKAPASGTPAAVQIARSADGKSGAPAGDAPSARRAK